MKGCVIDQMDVDTAFLDATITERVLVELPHGSDVVSGKLKPSWYDTGQLPLKQTL